MNLAQPLPVPQSIGKISPPEHVVFVLNPQERNLFLPHFGLMPGLSAGHCWVDASKLSPQAWIEKLRELKPTVLVTAWTCPALPVSWIEEKDCPLRYVCSITGSVKSRVPRVLIEKGLLVTNWGNSISHTVAEHAMLMVMALLRGLPQWPELMRHPAGMHEMMPYLRSRTLRGKRVGLHGFGAVARELVPMLKPFQVDLAAYSHGVPQALFDKYGVYNCGSLRELFSGRDILIECEGLNDHSRGTVTEEILRLLPADSIFVNVGRGMVADEAALSKLAGEGHLRVGLDVYQREPLPQTSPLFGNPRVILSPHVAGPTWDTYPLCGTQALDNLSKYLNGETPDCRVTLEAYDRAT
jgi:phosphoglycerate dehydrogenase-like enzyme